MTATFFSLLHHLAAFTLVAALAAEHLLFSRRIAPELMEKLRRVDAVYGLSAGVLLVAGLARVFYFEKSAAYYFGNPWFLLKFGLFILVGLLSVYPTVAFIRWKRNPQVSEAQARWIPRILRAQLLLVPIILFCAILMAKGFR